MDLKWMLVIVAIAFTSCDPTKGPTKVQIHWRCPQTLSANFELSAKELLFTIPNEVLLAQLGATPGTTGFQIDPAPLERLLSETQKYPNYDFSSCAGNFLD